jgi:hypothetical protein
MEKVWSRTRNGVGLRNSLNLYESIRLNNCAMRKKRKMKKIDREYSTQQVEEMQWLKKQGFNYSFVKVVDDITIFKFTKTPALFAALAYYYIRKMER